MGSRAPNTPSLPLRAQGQGVCREPGPQEQSVLPTPPQTCTAAAPEERGTCLRNQQALNGGNRHTDTPTLTGWQLPARGPLGKGLSAHRAGGQQAGQREARGRGRRWAGRGCTSRAIVFGVRSCSRVPAHKPSQGSGLRTACQAGGLGSPGYGMHMRGAVWCLCPVNALFLLGPIPGGG